MDFEEFASRIHGVKRTAAGGITGACPAHDDSVASFVAAPGEQGGIVVFCHAGCDVRDVVTAMGLSMHDLMGQPHIVAQYPYRDASGTLLWTVQRWHPKDFRCEPGLPEPALRVPYRLPELLAGVAAGRRVFVVEGEQDADNLAALGEVATCNVGGAGPGKFLPHYAGFFTGADVTIVADRDAPGVTHARAIAKTLAPVAARVVLAVARYGKDVTELLAAGFGLDALDPLPETDGIGAVQASNIRPRDVQWAWAGYIPMGKVTLVEGDPGDGKSILTVDLVARFTTGALMPDGTGHDGPFNVLMITAEDDPEDTIVPRLMAAGADLSRVTIITHGADETRPFSITEDIAAVYRLAMDHDVKLVVIDPLMAMIGEATDTHNDSSVRRALYPLYRLARDTGVAVLVVRHLNKGSGKAIYRGGGSIAFTGAARAVYSVGRDPDDLERRILSCVKINVAARPPSLAYTVDVSSAGPYVTWHGAVDLDAQTVLDGVSGEDAESRRELTGEVVDFLNVVVQNGAMTWKEIVAEGRGDGFTEKMLRARRRQSRLVKILGSEGGRSTRWGYAEHLIAAQSAATLSDRPAPHLPPLPHLPMVGVTERGGSDAASGTKPTTDSNWSAGLPPTGPTITQSNEAGVDDGPLARQDPVFPVMERGQAGQAGKRDSTDSDDALSDAQREADIMSMPLCCEICRSEQKVTRYLHPWWAVRCRAHSPLVYHEKGLDG